jgi:cobalt-precorrin 5A hydrolase
MTARNASDIAIYALTPQGARLARALAEALGGDVFLPRRFAAPGENAFDSLPGLVADTFHRYGGHVFVAACGIVVRAVAPYLRGKAHDPAVAVLDQNGRYAVSLLSGHLGGANDLARRAASVTGGEAVITTGTDSAGLPSLDVLARDCGLAIENLDAVKGVNAALLEGRAVQIFDPESRLALPAGHVALFEWAAAPHLLDPDRPAVIVDWRCPKGGFAVPGDPERPVRSGSEASPPRSDAGAVRLILRPRVVAAGVGCRKGVPGAEILAAIRDACEARGVAVKSLAALASIEAKRGEPGLCEAARALGADLVFYPAGQLAAVEVPNPSEAALKHMGVKSVCEAAALLAAGTDRLLLAKTKTGTVTVALALAS